jgi:hypothetical protein
VVWRLVFFLSVWAVAWYCMFQIPPLNTKVLVTLSDDQRHVMLICLFKKFLLKNIRFMAPLFATIKSTGN